MAKGNSSMDWKGKADSRPASSTAVKAQQHARTSESGLSWKDSPDSRPKSSPSAQKKVNLGGAKG